MMRGDFRIDEFAAQCFDAFERAFLVRPHQPRIAGDMGGEDCGEPAGVAIFCRTLGFRVEINPNLRSSPCVLQTALRASQMACWACTRVCCACAKAYADGGLGAARAPCQAA